MTEGGELYPAFFDPDKGIERIILSWEVSTRMAFRLGLPLTHEQLTRHLIAHDPAYLPHLQELLAPANWTLEQYYRALKEWEFPGVSKELKELKGRLQAEACNPVSTFMGDFQRVLELAEDRHDTSHLAFHVMGSEDEPLTHAELLSYYEDAVGYFSKAGFDITQLKWFWANE
jgi:hypothetical protein